MNFKDIKELIKIFDKTNLSQLKIKDNEFSITLEKGNIEKVVKDDEVIATIQSTTIEATKSEPVVNKNDSYEVINSPMVGTFYKSPCPDCNSFVKVGDKVNKGDVLGIIEAMKIMNELEAEFNCKIIEILVEDGQPVEYDMPLFKIERL